MVDWFKVLNIGLNAGQFIQLNESRKYLKGMEASEAAKNLKAETLETLRDFVFASNKSAEPLLERLESEPQKVLVMGRLLAWRMDYVGISPKLFPEFKDKEYVDQTQAKIAKLVEDTTPKLTEAQIHEATDCFIKILEMPSLNSAIEIESNNENIRKNKQRAIALNQEIKSTDEEWMPLASAKNRRVVIGSAIGIAIPLMACFTAFIFSSIVQKLLSGLPRESRGMPNMIFGGCLPLLFILVIMVGSIVFGIRYAQKAPSERYTELEKQRSDLKKQIPTIQQETPLTDRYVNLTLEELLELRESHQNFIKKIMGDSDEDYDYDMVFLQ